jgi:phosphoenolpyruvate synthase/pyruvate phosphate dikinase
VFEWMSSEFRRLEALPPGSPEEQRASESLRAEIFDVIRTTDPGPGFRTRLRAAMDREFGADFTGGVFVRSDTNVEDLPGFTGAGINLTLPNVVGFENVMKALGEVWASPFSPRSFAWRRGNMTGPEHVYPAVLLLRTVPSEKSGVMVTQDLDTGDRAVLSIAVNEGAQGAVEGQAAETLRVDTRNGSVRLLAAATAPWKQVPVPTGGVLKERTSGTEEVLHPAEIDELVAFGKALPTRFPPIVDGEGKPTAADVEFAFVGGKLFLLQIRPFNESARARENVYLQQLDEGGRGRLGGAVVPMNEVPEP